MPHSLSYREFLQRGKDRGRLWPRNTSEAGNCSLLVWYKKKRMHSFSEDNSVPAEELGPVLPYQITCTPECFIPPPTIHTVAFKSLQVSGQKPYHSLVIVSGFGVRFPFPVLEDQVSTMSHKQQCQASHPHRCPGGTAWHSHPHGHSSLPPW